MIMSTDERSTWADLAPELLELIFQRLTLVDYFKCREICSCWRKAVNDALATEGRCPPLPQLPSLLIASSNNNKNNPFKLMSLTQHGSVLTMSTQSYVDDLVDHSLETVHSVQGWLMFNRTHYESEKDQTFSELSFFNPVSLARFKLPILSLFSGPGRYYRGSNSQIAFASAPSSQEFLVVYLIHHLDIQDMQKQRLAFCKVRTRKSWTAIETVETQATIIRSIAAHDGKLYATTWETTNSMLIFNLGDRDAKAITVERLVTLHPNLSPRNSEGYRHKLAMDTTRGELLLVYEFIKKANATDESEADKKVLLTTRFRVFKLDLGRWSEIEDLGDRFLFVDWAGARVVYARDLEGAREFNGGNCIFYCYAVKSPKYDVGVFSLADKRIKRLPTSSSLPPARSSLRATWFSPSPW